VDFAFPLAMIAHARDAAPWMLGETASDGLKLLAETGASAALVAEAEARSLVRLAPEALDHPDIAQHLCHQGIEGADVFLGPPAQTAQGASELHDAEPGKGQHQQKQII